MLAAKACAKYLGINTLGIAADTAKEVNDSQKEPEASIEGVLVKNKALQDRKELKVCTASNFSNWLLSLAFQSSTIGYRDR